MSELSKLFGFYELVEYAGNLVMEATVSESGKHPEFLRVEGQMLAGDDGTVDVLFYAHYTQVVLYDEMPDFPVEAEDD